MQPYSSDSTQASWDLSGFVANGDIMTEYVFSQIKYPNAVRTFVTDINNKGVIAGSFTDFQEPSMDKYTENPLHGFIKEDEKYTPIDFPGAASTAIHDVNDNGQIIGRFVNDLSKNSIYISGSSFAYSNGNYIQISYPGAEHTIVKSINNSGQIIGSASGRSDSAAFVWRL